MRIESANVPLARPVCLLCLVLAALSVSGGCAHRHLKLSELLDEKAAPTVYLAETPFFPQTDYHCGPAALATILQQSGVSVTPAQLVEQVYLPRRRGSLQLELQAATRRHGRIAYLIEPDPAALLAELQHGRAVLVLQNLGLRSLPVWHYAVVVGYDAVRNRFLLRSGTERLLDPRIGEFLRAWQRADYWGLVALRADEAPARPVRGRWLQSITAVDETGRSALSIAAYRSFLARFPNDPIARLGLANAYASASDHARAESLYRDLLRRNPKDVAARNNLALSLAARACHDEALAQIQQALSQAPPDSAFRPMLVDTLGQITRAARRAPDLHQARELSHCRYD